MGDKHIVITVSGPPSCGKAVILAEIATVLTARGLTVELDMDSELGFEEAALLSSDEERTKRFEAIESTITLMEVQTPRTAFEKIKDGLDNAIAYANGNTDGSVTHVRGH